MENQNITQRHRILLMGQYKSLFIKGAFPSLKKKKDNEYQKIIHYNDNLIEISIIEIDDPYSMELDEFKNDNQKSDILALFAIDGTDETFLVETDSIIEELKNKYQNSDLTIKDYILLGIIPNNYNNDLLDSNGMSLFTLHKIAEKQNCFCYEMEESEEEIDYNIFLLNYAMFSWIEFDKIYSNEELLEMIEKNTGYENKDIKVKKIENKEMKVISEKKNQNQKKEIADSKKKEKIKEKIKEKEKEKKELSSKKILKLKIKEEIKKMFEAIKIKNSFKINGSENNKDKNNFLNFLNFSTYENKDNKKELKDKIKDRLIRIYKKENLEIFRCIYCHEIPEIKIINDKYVEIKCNNGRDENHIGKRNILTIKQFLDINFNLMDKVNQISYAKCKCIYCHKNRNDIMKETTNFINIYQNDTKNLSINEIKNDFFYYFNENKIFYCNICKNIVCQKCKKYHTIYCSLDDNNKIDDINSNSIAKEINYESYKEIKNLIDEKLVDYESEIKLNKQFMPLYMYDSYCQKHKKLFNYYCENCSQNLCSECLNHNNHNILNWMDIDNLWNLKQDEITREKNELVIITKKANNLINILSRHLNNLIQNLKDVINFKEKILINSKYINNNYNMYKNLKNIQFNFKIFDKEKYEKENNVIKKLCILCEYLNNPYSIINHNLFNSNIEDSIYKNVSIVNKNIINNNIKNDITSLIIFEKKKLINCPNNNSNENNNIFAYSTNQGDVNFYKNEKNGIFSKICSFYLFEENQGIFDLKKIKHNFILCGGFEQLKIISVKLFEKKYDIINIINKSNSSFVKNWALNNNLILSYFPNKKEINLIKYTKNELENNCIPWMLLNKNEIEDKDIDFIINNQFVLISLIKLKNEKYKNRFVISISNNEKQNESDKHSNKKYKDCLLFYSIKYINNDNIEDNINLEKIMHIPSIVKSEYNLFEISYSNLLVCKLDSSNEKIAIINTSNYTIEKIIQLTNSELIKNYSFFNSTFFMKYKSIYFKKDYYLSINKDLNLIQWYFNKDTIEFIPIDNLPLKFIKEDINFKGSKNKIIKQLLFYLDNNCLIALTNDNLIFNIFLES